MVGRRIDEVYDGFPVNWRVLFFLKLFAKAGGVLKALLHTWNTEGGKEMLNKFGFDAHNPINSA